MKEQFVTYEIALAFKELGFDEECLAIIYKDDIKKELLFSVAEKYSSNPPAAKHQARDAIRQINFDKGWAIKVPLWQQAIDWFNVNKNITIRPCLFNSNWQVHEYEWDENDCIIVDDREQAILKAIDIAKV